MIKRFSILLLSFILLTSITFAQNNDEEKEDKSPYKSSTFNGLKFRLLGPAITSGRIADIAVHPDNRSVYYVATASGGVWKTKNWGNTFKPIFDSQGSYSIGCVTMDSNLRSRIKPAHIIRGRSHNFDAGVGKTHGTSPLTGGA